MAVGNSGGRGEVLQKIYDIKVASSMALVTVGWVTVQTSYLSENALIK